MSSSLLTFAGNAANAAVRTRRRLVGSSCSPTATLMVFCNPSQLVVYRDDLVGLPQQLQQQQRDFSVWVDVIRIKKQRQRDHKKVSNSNSATKPSQMVHEDPEQVVRRHTDEVRSDGEALLDLMFYNDRHEKAWRKRQRLQNLRRYQFDKKHVTDLAKYIAFVQDYGDKN